MEKEVGNDEVVLQELDLYIYIQKNMLSVAISKLDKNKLKPNFNFEKLSLMEEEHLLTKASIPYRDQDLKSSKDDIIKKRLDEQLFSTLVSTNKWREKWGMTK